VGSIPTRFRQLKGETPYKSGVFAYLNACLGKHLSNSSLQTINLNFHLMDIYRKLMLMNFSLVEKKIILMVPPSN